MNDKTQQPGNLTASPSGRLRLVLLTLALGFVWLAVLPWIASRPSIAARQRWLESRRIDPSAMFYTELDAMQPILDRLETRHSSTDAQ